MKRRPYQQGWLDCLCGVYGIVNALQALRGRDDHKNLFEEILGILAKKRLLLRAVTVGLNTHEISRLLNAVAPDEVLKALPWRGRGKKTPGLDVFWRSMQDFLAAPAERVILLGIGGKYEHWTVVDRITDDHIFLRDSDSLKRLSRKRSTTSTTTSRRVHLLAPGSAFFLKRHTQSA
jgi:hypothetical protein